MKISTRFGGVIVTIILIIALLMAYTLTSLNNINDVTREHQEQTTLVMVKALDLQKDIIQIQQWLTDISATRGKPGFDDGFERAEDYYQSAKNNIATLKELGADQELMDSISQELDEFYQMGIDMANTYIHEGTDEGNALMEEFDPYAATMEESVEELIQEANINFSEGNKEVSTKLQNLLRRSIVLFSVVILISIFSYIIIQKFVLQPLKNLTNMLKDISEGEGDLTKRVNIKSKDEFGTMARYFNDFIDTVHKIVLSIKEMSHQVSNVSEELTASSQQSAATAEEINHAIEEIAQGATHQAGSSNEGSEKLESLGNLIREHKEDMEVFTKTSDAIEHLAIEGLDVIDRLSQKTGESSNATHSVYQSILKTNESSEKINEASSLIASIAEQTNLLSLNASIEAARAGEHGRGFAVVAEEIRKLAEQSTEATKIIDDMIKSLQQDSAKAVRTMEEVEGILKEQFENVNVTESKYKEIAQEINQSSERVTTINQVVRQMEHMKEEVLETIQALSEVAQENAAGTQQASASIQQQTASIEEIANASERLSSLFQGLQTKIERFTV